MPDARRDESRRTEGQSECVEARPLFGGGYRGAAPGPGTGAPKPGNSEHNLSRLAKQAPPNTLAQLAGGCVGHGKLLSLELRFKTSQSYRQAATHVIIPAPTVDSQYRVSGLVR